MNNYYKTVAVYFIWANYFKLKYYFQPGGYQNIYSRTYSDTSGTMAIFMPNCHFCTFVPMQRFWILFRPNDFLRSTIKNFSFFCWKSVYGPVQACLLSEFSMLILSWLDLTWVDFKVIQFGNDIRELSCSKGRLISTYIKPFTQLILQILQTFFENIKWMKNT